MICDLNPNIGWFEAKFLRVKVTSFSFKKTFALCLNYACLDDQSIQHIKSQFHTISDRTFQMFLYDNCRGHTNFQVPTPLSTILGAAVTVGIIDH